MFKSRFGQQPSCLLRDASLGVVGSPLSILGAMLDTKVIIIIISTDCGTQLPRL